MKKNPGKLVREVLTTLLFVVGVAALVYFVSHRLEGQQSSALDDGLQAADGSQVTAPVMSVPSAASMDFSLAKADVAQKDPTAKDATKATTPPTSTPATVTKPAATGTTPAATGSTPAAGAKDGGTQVSVTEFFAQMRLNNEQARGSREESLKALLASRGVDDDTKKQANAELLWLAKSGALERQAEDIIRTQGITPVVVNLFEQGKATVLVGMQQISLHQAIAIAETIEQVASISQEHIRIVLQKQAMEQGA